MKRDEGMNRRNISKLAFAIVVICFMMSTFVSLWSLRLMAAQNLKELSKTLAARIYDTIISDLSEPVMVSQTMANDLFLIDLLEQEKGTDSKQIETRLANYLSRIKTSLGYEAAFVVSDVSRKYYSYAGLNKFMDLERSERDQWYSQFLESGSKYELDVDRDELAQDMWTIFVDARIESDSGKLLGVCGVGAQMTGTQALFTSLENEYNVRIDLVDAGGVIQMDTDETRLGQVFPQQVALGSSEDYVFQQLSSDRILVSKYVDRLGWTLVVQSDGSDQKKQFINVIVLNAGLCVLVLVIVILAMRIIAARTRALANASFTDQATQLLNRRAFEEEKTRLSLQPMPADLAYVTADLNGLKAANDNLGHAAGDEMIRGAAECLRTCLGKYGKIYRIGGDEFAAIITLPEAQLGQTMAELEATAAAWNGNFIHGISMACGWATCREFPSENIAELSRISDERMYAAKDQYYRKTGKARRT